MFIFKCLPIMDTAVNAVETVVALAEGDGKKCVAKLAQAKTRVGAAMDSAFVMSGGLSSLMTAPLTGTTIEGGKIVSKKLMSEMIVKEADKITTNVAVRAVTQYAADKASKSGEGQRSSSGRSSSTYTITNSARNVLKLLLLGGTGSGNDPPRENPKLSKEHYDTEIESGTENSITEVILGQNGRVERLEATIRKRHLKPRGQRRRPISARVRRFIESLGKVNSDEKGVREQDEVGHLVGDSLRGPSDRTYNFIPQSPHCNLTYYSLVERKIYNYLEEHDHQDYVLLSVEMVYIDNFKGLSSDRPVMIKVHLKYSNGKESSFKISNMI